ncbi:hypothetical protein L7F22_005445 [Adiantum nelumboides]|nr:hypothetical protein [Adiantum nelumboides]
MPQNRWYDDECRNLHRHLRVLEISGEITYRQAQRRMRTLTRRKRREWEEHQYWDIYHLLMSQDSAEASRRFRPPRPPTPIQDPATWHRYAESLYEIPGQPPIPTPSATRPISSTFFTTHMVKKAISHLQHGRARDQAGLQAKHLIYGCDALAPLIAHLFNRALSEGFPESWTGGPGFQRYLSRPPPMYHILYPISVACF